MKMVGTFKEGEGNCLVGNEAVLPNILPSHELTVVLVACCRCSLLSFFYLLQTKRQMPVFWVNINLYSISLFPSVCLSEGFPRGSALPGAPKIIIYLPSSIEFFSVLPKMIFLKLP